jgi:hypothetical protein
MYRPMVAVVGSSIWRVRYQRPPKLALIARRRDQGPRRRSDQQIRCLDVAANLRSKNAFCERLHLSTTATCLAPSKISATGATTDRIYGFLKRSGSVAMFSATRQASSLVKSAADRLVFE